MFRQNETAGMPWQHGFRMQICRSLRRFFRHHVNKLPVLVILTVLHNRQIDRAKLLADGFKMRSIAGIAAVINVLLRRFEHEARP